MSAPKERLTLVTDFNALKAGDLVATSHCSACGGWHRGILTSFLRNVIGPLRMADAWLIEPGHGEGKNTWVDAVAVAGKFVYLIDTGLSDSETTETAKPRRLERVR